MGFSVTGGKWRLTYGKDGRHGSSNKIPLGTEAAKILLTRNSGNIKSVCGAAPRLKPESALPVQI